LETCRDLLQSLCRDRQPDAPPADSTSEGAPAEAAAAGGDRKASGPIRNREAAFQSLLQVAEFFKRTEPHSPISYALEQAVRWGRMPLPDLLTELIPEEAARLQLFKLVGITPPGKTA